MYGGKTSRSFDSETALVDYLVETYETEAPVSVEYDDGNQIDRELMLRIHDRMFALRKSKKPA